MALLSRDRHGAHALLLTLAFACFSLASSVSLAFEQAPMLAELVARGDLPSLDRRLPANPEVEGYDWPGQGPGQYGGELSMLASSSKDGKILVWFGYARLVRYDASYRIVPDILESFDVEEGRIFTFHLRKGHRWSDGSPFTTEDFRYFWEDVANDPDLAPTGPPVEMLVDGVPPRVEVLSETAIRYAWPRPNPAFLPALAGAYPLFIFRPSGYLKRFHSKYVNPEELKQQVAAHDAKNWATLHNKLDNQYNNDNPELPSLDPWIPTNKPPAGRLVFTRNPYFFRVDSQGRQLPYIDKVVLQVSDQKLIPLKAGAGEATLQSRHLRFEDYTFLKEGERDGGYRVLLWHDGRGSALALYPNLNATDPVWRTLNRDARYRRALSVGIDRREINEFVYFGLAREAGNTVLPKSPLYKPEYGAAYANYDPVAANRLLDEIGLTRRDSAGYRLLPDGRPLTIVVDGIGQVPEETNVLELLAEQWRLLGIRLFWKPFSLEVFRNRVFAGTAVMSVWTGLDNGIPTADTMPSEMAPVLQDSLQWPKWGQQYQTRGMSGEAPDLPEARALLALFAAWTAAPDEASRTAIWWRMLQIHAEQVFTIGIVSDARQPVVVSRRLHNLPEEGISCFDPGAYFGIYHPDLFWIEPDNQPSTRRSSLSPSSNAKSQ